MAFGEGLWTAVPGFEEMRCRCWVLGAGYEADSVDSPFEGDKGDV